jgi:hypothetical protein
MSALDQIIISYQDAGGLKTELPQAARAALAQLRADLQIARAERDAFAAENDAVHRVVNEMCGTDTSTIGAVQHVIEARNAALQYIAELVTDLHAARVERDALRDRITKLEAQLKLYQRGRALRN